MSVLLVTIPTRLIGLTRWQWAVLLILSALIVAANPPTGGPVQFIQWFFAGVVILYLVGILPLTAYRLTFGKS